MIAVHVHRGGRTTRVERVEPGWLSPASGVIVWVDMVSPGPEEAGLLRDTFHFHELAVEDALSAILEAHMSNVSNRSSSSRCWASAA